MGGIHVDIESIKNKDTLQLQQIIIFLKSEIVKHQNEISTLKNMDYYSIVNSLEQENSQLINEKKELSLELRKMRKTFEKELNDLHENIQLRENQRIKLISSIEALVKKKVDLQKENKKLKVIIEKTENELSTTRLESPELILQDSMNTVENIDNTLWEYIKKSGQQLTAIYEELKKNRNEAIDINEYLLKEIQSKSDKIDMLMRENEELKEQHQKKLPSPLDNKAVKNTDMHFDLENQIQKLFIQTIDFEAQLDEKLRILDDLEFKLLQLANKIRKQETDNKNRL
ncbi:multidrug ABC transporter ATPase [Solibacillus silvestris]|uniref:multidrug ABC transporter ATPase n=1 Tax=Solibacillus silvestris TaxID=76853 RepID=UPI003F81D523